MLRYYIKKMTPWRRARKSNVFRCHWRDR